MADCIMCGKKVLDYKPQYCCSGFECNCRGLPIEPPICSQKCWSLLCKVENQDMEEEPYDCPIHGLQDGPECPRC